jgi:hypothetical protein
MGITWFTTLPVSFALGKGTCHVPSITRLFATASGPEFGETTLCTNQGKGIRSVSLANDVAYLCPTGRNVVLRGLRDQVIRPAPQKNMR